MTDKEIAIDWIRSQGWNEENLPSDELLQMERAFLAGLEASRSPWHDLQKDPTDLPRQGVELLVSVDGYTRTAMYSKETNSFTCQDGVIAWMYEPEFRKVTLEKKEVVFTDRSEGYCEGYEKGFQNGVELGYKWHKQEIDDIFGLISKDWSVRHFICIMKDKSCVTATGNCDESCNGEVSVNLVFDHDDEKYYIDDIVWWKEIVLPKENG